MRDREPGWYWVKDGEETGGQWVPWEWIGESDLLSARWYHSLSFAEVGPRIPTPDEPWATVPIQPDEPMIDAVFWSWGSTDVRAVYIDMVSSAPNP